MSKKIKFKYKEIKDLNKVIVYIDYIDRKFFDKSYKEKWKYNGVEFLVSTYINRNKGFLGTDYVKGKLCNFRFYIGLEDNFFVVNEKEVKIFKNLENKVYNDENKILSEYLNKRDNGDIIYYHIRLNYKNLTFYIDSYKLEFDNIDKELFKIGNMFSSEKEAEKYVDKLNSNEITLEKFKEDRQDFFKYYIFE